MTAKFSYFFPHALSHSVFWFFLGGKLGNIVTQTLTCIYSDFIKATHYKLLSINYSSQQ